MPYLLSRPTEKLLEEINILKLNQSSVARTYSLAIQAGDTDWQAVNEAIINRWSVAGLNRVKQMAWRHLETSQPPKEEPTP